MMGAYRLNFITRIRSDSVIIEQGQEIGRNGLVTVNVSKLNENILVEIEGSSVFVKEMLLSI